MFLTLMLSICSDGSMLPPFVIAKKKQYLRNKDPSKMILVNNARGWITEELMNIWIKKIYNNIKVDKHTLKVLILD